MVKRMLFLVFNKIIIQIRKLPTVVDGFGIQCFAVKRSSFGVLRPKIQIGKLSTIISSFRRRVLHFKTHVLRSFGDQNQNTESAYNCGQFPYTDFLSLNACFWCFAIYNPSTQKVYNIKGVSVFRC